MRKNKPTNYLNQNGVTLIELVIYIALTALLLVVNLGILVNILRVRAETIEMEELDFSLNNFSSTITQDLRWADTGTISSGGTEGTTGDTLVISRDNGGTPEEIKYHYDAIKEVVYKTEPSGAEYQISPDGVAITTFLFENRAAADQNPSIRVTIEGHSEASLRQTPTTITTAVTIRRKSA